MQEKRPLTKSETKDKALRLLEFRSHSEYELREKLKRAGAEPFDIDEIIEFCKEYRFLNDTEYAKHCARDLSHLKKYGKNRIKTELFRRGLSAEDIEDAILEIEDDEDELQKQIEKRLKNNFDKKNIDKQIRYFLYRGYELSDIKNIVERLKSNEF